MGTVAIYRNTTPSAPAYSNTNGSFISVMDFCMVTGQGWSKTVVSSNIAVYTQPGGTNGFAIQVDDNTSGANWTRIFGYETWSALNTGTNQIPTAAQMTGLSFGNNNGFYVDKPQGTYTGGAPWRLLTNGAIFYFFSQCNSANLDDYTGFCFGDILSYLPSDKYGTIIAGHGTANNNHKIFAAGYSNALHTTSGAAANSVGYLVRSAHGFGGGWQMGWVTDAVHANQNTSSGECTLAVNQFPQVVDGALWLSPVWASEPYPPSGGNYNPSLGIRGLIPGIWFLNTAGHLFPDGFQFTCGSGQLAGRTMEIVGAQLANNVQGQLAIEVSNTWGGI